MNPGQGIELLRANYLFAIYLELLWGKRRKEKCLFDLHAI